MEKSAGKMTHCNSEKNVFANFYFFEEEYRRLRGGDPGRDAKVAASSDLVAKLLVKTGRVSEPGMSRASFRAGGASPLPLTDGDVRMNDCCCSADTWSLPRAFSFLTRSCIVMRKLRNVMQCVLMNG